MRNDRIALLTAALLALQAGCQSSAPSKTVAKAPSQKEAPASAADLRTLLTMNVVDAKDARPLRVTSAAFREGGPIPFEHSDLGQKYSPPLAVEGVPAGTQTFVVLMEDPDAPAPRPFDHWVLYDLPAAQAALREGVPGQPKLMGLGGAMQGPNSYGSTGYFGPHPPAEHGPHRYYFQVFAIDGPLGLPPNATKAQVVAAMKGRVLAKGHLMGKFDNETGR